MERRKATTRRTCYRTVVPRGSFNDMIESIGVLRIRKTGTPLNGWDVHYRQTASRGKEVVPGGKDGAPANTPEPDTDTDNEVDAELYVFGGVSVFSGHRVEQQITERTFGSSNELMQFLSECERNADPTSPRPREFVYDADDPTHELKKRYVCFKLDGNEQLQDPYYVHWEKSTIGSPRLLHGTIFSAEARPINLRGNPINGWLADPLVGTIFNWKVCCTVLADIPSQPLRAAGELEDDGDDGDDGGTFISTLYDAFRQVLLDAPDLDEFITIRSLALRTRTMKEYFKLDEKELMQVADCLERLCIATNVPDEFDLAKGAHAVVCARLISLRYLGKLKQVYIISLLGNCKNDPQKALPSSCHRELANKLAECGYGDAALAPLACFVRGPVKALLWSERPPSGRVSVTNPLLIKLGTGETVVFDDQPNPIIEDELAGRKDDTDEDAPTCLTVFRKRLYEELDGTLGLVQTHSGPIKETVVATQILSAPKVVHAMVTQSAPQCAGLTKQMCRCKNRRWGVPPVYCHHHNHQYMWVAQLRAGVRVPEAESCEWLKEYAAAPKSEPEQSELEQSVEHLCL